MIFYWTIFTNDWSELRETLHERLERTEGSVPTRRVMAVIRLKRGVEIQKIATSQNGCEKTIRK